MTARTGSTVVPELNAYENKILKAIEGALVAPSEQKYNNMQLLRTAMKSAAIAKKRAQKELNASKTPKQEQKARNNLRNASHAESVLTHTGLFNKIYKSATGRNFPRNQGTVRNIPKLRVTLGNTTKRIQNRRNKTPSPSSPNRAFAEEH
jgi:hypothetical protein